MDPMPKKNEPPPADDESEGTAVSRRVKRGFVWNQIGGMLDYGLYLMFAVLIARTIGVQEFGLYGLIISYASLGLILTGLGMERATHVHIPPLRESGGMVYLMRRFLRVRVGMGVGVGVALFLLAGPAMSLLGQPRVGALLRWTGPYMVHTKLKPLKWGFA